MNRPLFVYGSMRDEDVRALVLGRDRSDVQSEAAWMPDAEVALVPGESYPYLVSVEGARAPGEVLYGLDEVCLDRIHFFENDEYALVEREVEGADGDRIAAMHFGGVAIPEAPIVPWSLAQWRATEKTRFLAMTREYMAMWKHATPDEADALWQRMLREHSADGTEG